MPSLPARRPIATLLVLCTLALVACSSTGEKGKGSRRGTVRSGSDASSSGDAATPGSSDTTAPGATATTAGRSGARGRAGSSTPGASTPGPGIPAIGPVRPGEVAQGVTANEIAIGVMIQVKAGAAAQFGVQGISDFGQDAADAVVKDINARGGIAGRRVKPVYFTLDVTRGTFATEAQAACARWTEDTKVLAVAGWGYDRDTLVSCLAKKNTPLVKESVILPDERLYQRFRGFLYSPTIARAERMTFWIDDLADAKFLTKDSKIGLLRYDTPEHDRAADTVLKPRLAARGLKLADEVRISNFEATAELADVGAQTQNAVLRFRSRGIDKVLILDTGPTIGMFFMIAAEAQGFRPKYGLTSYNYVSYLIENVPAPQLVGSMGVGWMPASDVYPGTAANAASDRCLKSLKAAGIPPQTNSDGLVGVLSLCSRLYFLTEALSRAPALTPAGLLSAVEQMGERFVSPHTFKTRFGPGRYDAAATFRRFTFDQACPCFKYVGPPTPMP